MYIVGGEAVGDIFTNKIILQQSATRPEEASSYYLKNTFLVVFLNNFQIYVECS